MPPNQYLTDREALEQYVDDLIKLKNSPYVKGENIAVVKEDLLQEVSDAINSKLISLLSDDEVKQLNETLDKEVSDEQVSLFFTGKIKDLQQVVTDVLIEFRKGYLSVIYDENANKVENKSASVSISAPTIDVPKKTIDPTDKKTILPAPELADYLVNIDNAPSSSISPAPLKPVKMVN